MPTQTITCDVSPRRKTPWYEFGKPKQKLKQDYLIEYSGSLPSIKIDLAEGPTEEEMVLCRNIILSNNYSILMTINGVDINGVPTKIPPVRRLAIRFSSEKKGTVTVKIKTDRG